MGECQPQSPQQRKMPHKNKTQAKENALYNKLMFGTYAAAQFLFVVLRLCRRWDTVGSLVLVGYVSLTAASGWCIKAIFSTRETARVNDIRANKIGVEYLFDVYCLSVCVLFGVALISDYFWLVYAAVPGYIGYRGMKYLVNWVFTPTQGEIEAQQTRMESTMKKQQRKERKVRNKRR